MPLPPPLSPFPPLPLVALSTLSPLFSAALPILSKLAASSLAFFAAPSAKSEIPSRPLFIMSNPALANFPTPGNLERTVSIAFNGPKTTFIIAS